MSFKSMKKDRSKAIEKLTSAAEEVNQKNTYGDDRFWQPTVDKAGNGFAVIRFLPVQASGDNALPWVRYWSHGFKGPTGRWYIENCRTSLGEDDPVAEGNSVLWNSGVESDKKIARDRKRRLHYVSNILVLSDPGNPENEGKQFLYKYGKKIFDKITDIMQPQFQDEEAVNPFDFWDGANFKLKIRKFEGYRNYDKSEFEKPSELLKGDEAVLEEIYNKLVDLSEFLDPKNYKSYDELKKKMIAVLGGGNNDAPSAPEPETETAAEPSQPSAEAEDQGGEDDTMSYFKKLAKGE